MIENEIYFIKGRFLELDLQVSSLSELRREKVAWGEDPRDLSIHDIDRQISSIHEKRKEIAQKFLKKIDMEYWMFQKDDSAEIA
jgi:hypothetical protein